MKFVNYTRYVESDIHISFKSHYGPGVDTVSNRNEYQESSWG
jgi:hypothetical protein